MANQLDVDIVDLVSSESLFLQMCINHALQFFVHYVFVLSVYAVIQVGVGGCVDIEIHLVV